MTLTDTRHHLQVMLGRIEVQLSVEALDHAGGRPAILSALQLDHAALTDALLRLDRVDEHRATIWTAFSLAIDDRERHKAACERDDSDSARSEARKLKDDLQILRAAQLALME